MTTQEQKYSILFCEEVLNIEFQGDKNNYFAIKNFLKTHLELANRLHKDRVKTYYDHLKNFP